MSVPSQSLPPVTLTVNGIPALPVGQPLLAQPEHSPIPGQVRQSLLAEPELSRMPGQELLNNFSLSSAAFFKVQYF